MTDKKRKTGRPSRYSDETTAEICRRLAEGESLRKVCADKTMPDKATVLRAPGPGADDPHHHHPEPSRARIFRV